VASGTLRGSAAAAATRATNALSRVLRLGSGTVAGGRVGMAIDPSLLARLSAGRVVALVSGTNGKTTTTRLLAAALGAGGDPVVSNDTGANMPAGHLAALVDGPAGVPVVLEVDEAYLPTSAAALRPGAIVLLNLSRDQLDRINEVRMLAGRWRASLGQAAGTAVVANADDPLVAWAALAAPRVVWVAAGLGWRNDAVGCPRCDGRIAFAPGGGDWRCTRCDLARPEPAVWVEGGDGGEAVVRWAGGRRLPVVIGLPGRFNVANAVMSATAAETLGYPVEQSLRAMAAVGEVAGRFGVRRLGGVPVRLLLAKNPAGWAELLELLRAGWEPVVVSINARVADGRDPSWLWDVPFEVLAGRVVVATGDRGADLSVRLHYAGVAHHTVGDLSAAVATAARLGGRAAAAGPVQLIGNYTAFSDALARSGEGSAFRR
jgi:UDP-N-acetylmuramyl tripeptide synthase